MNIVEGTPNGLLLLFRPFSLWIVVSITRFQSGKLVIGRDESPQMVLFILHLKMFDYIFGCRCMTILFSCK